MALTAITLVRREQLGFSNLTISTLSLDNSYPTGGYSLTPTQLGIGLTADWVSAQPKSGYIFEYFPSTSKLMVRWSGAAGAIDPEVTSATDLSAVTGVRIMAIGR
jgi:hypothetical protein